MKHVSQLFAVLLLVILAFVATSTSPSDAWPFGRRAADDAAPSDRLIPTTKRTVANVEDITEGIKAGLVAAGATIDSRNNVRLAGADPNEAITAVPVDPPQQQPTHNTAVPAPRVDAQTRPSCSGGVCAVGDAEWTPRRIFKRNRR